MTDLWYPPESLVENSNVKRFMERHGLNDYRDLIQRSVKDIEWFWSEAEKELGVEWFQPCRLCFTLRHPPGLAAADVHHN